MMRALLLGLCLMTASCSSLTQIPDVSAQSALKGGNYTLDAKHAALLFRISHFGLSHYTGRFTGLSADLYFDQANPQASRLSASVDVATLQVTPASFAKTLTGPDWLDAQRFPTASFELGEVIVMGANTGKARGQLTLRGVTQPVSFDVSFTAGALHPVTQKYAIGFKASASIKRSDFGITKLLSVAGDKFDFDTVTLEFDGEFVKS